jgi:hypothetical protein
MLANLRALFGVFVDLMFLRRGPENLPPSRQLLAIIAIVHIAVHALADQIFIAPLRPESVPVLPGQVIATVFMMLWFRVALQLAGKPERFVQTMIAVFFTSLLSVFLVPLVAVMLPYIAAAQATPDAAARAPGSVVLLAALGTLWILAILTRIVKSAFEWSWGAAVSFVLLSTFGVPLLLGVIFGGVAKPA